MYTDTADQYKLRRSPPEAGGWPIQTQYEQELEKDAFALLRDIHWWKFTNTVEVQQPRNTWFYMYRGKILKFQTKKKSHTDLC